MTPFREAVFAVVKKIPKGETLTYKDVAERIGNPKASRAVGGALKINFDPAIPCHRVICSGGSIGGYNRGVEKKRSLLRAEGVDI